jgi:hypothetical protein
MFTFIETRLFSRIVGDYLTDTDYAKVQAALIEDPPAAKSSPALVAFERCGGQARVAGNEEAFASSTSSAVEKRKCGCSRFMRRTKSRSFRQRSFGKFGRR